MGRDTTFTESTDSNTNVTIVHPMALAIIFVLSTFVHLIFLFQSTSSFYLRKFRFIFSNNLQDIMGFICSLHYFFFLIQYHLPASQNGSRHSTLALWKLAGAGACYVLAVGLSCCTPCSDANPRRGSFYQWGAVFLSNLSWLVVLVNCHFIIYVFIINLFHYNYSSNKLEYKNQVGDCFYKN